MTGPTSETPAVLYGLRCDNPHHTKSGEVYGINPEWQHLARLTNDGCSELVVSVDGGVTWATAPMVGNLLQERLRQAEQLIADLRAELAVVMGERDDALLLVQDGMPEPCQPIGCDNGHHLPGCVYAAADAGEAVIGRE